VIPVFDALNSFRDLQLARTKMSPMGHAYTEASSIDWSTKEKS